MNWASSPDGKGTRTPLLGFELLMNNASYHSIINNHNTTLKISQRREEENEASLGSG